MIFQKSYLMGFKLILVALLDRNSRREILKLTNFALRIIRWGFSVIWNRIYCNDSYKVIDSSSIAPDILIFIFPNYLKTKFPSDPWTNIDPGCGSVPLFKSRNVLSSHKKQSTWRLVPQHFLHSKKTSKLQTVTLQKSIISILYQP